LQFQCIIYSICGQLVDGRSVGGLCFKFWGNDFMINDEKVNHQLQSAQVAIEKGAK